MDAISSRSLFVALNLGFFLLKRSHQPKTSLHALRVARSALASIGAAKQRQNAGDVIYAPFHPHHIRYRVPHNGRISFDLISDSRSTPAPEALIGRIFGRSPSYDICRAVPDIGLWQLSRGSIYVVISTKLTSGVSDLYCDVRCRL